ncbi:hypothetical protein EMA8858_02329 [Emticicia aquatica]|uniref:Uncharacterized protein n=2 Tax=Emticicia aquatica TaxID=1681835 RepID=A0ABM9AQM9_9BACT|nr:hypothetical protein EMA8858_02329 [Emticicia aquatica]
MAVNPYTNRLINLTPLFNYMKQIEEAYSINGACISHISEVVDNILEGPSELMNQALDSMDYDDRFTIRAIRGYSESVNDAQKLAKVFRAMKVDLVTNVPQKDEILPPMPTRYITATVFLNPETSEIFKIEPLFEFIKKYSSERNSSVENTANVIENTAKVTDEENPNLDLTNCTDLVRDVANLLRGMKVS